MNTMEIKIIMILILIAFFWYHLRIELVLFTRLNSHFVVYRLIDKISKLHY